MRSRGISGLVGGALGIIAAEVIVYLLPGEQGVWAALIGFVGGYGGWTAGYYGWNAR